MATDNHVCTFAPSHHVLARTPDEVGEFQEVACRPDIRQVNNPHKKVERVIPSPCFFVASCPFETSAHPQQHQNNQYPCYIYQGSHQVTNFLKPEFVKASLLGISPKKTLGSRHPTTSFPHLSCCFANDFCGNGSTSESCIWHHLVRRDWGNSKTWGRSSFIGGFRVTLGGVEKIWCSSYP